MLKRVTDVMRAYVRSEPLTLDECIYWEMESEEVARDYLRMLLKSIPEIQWRFIRKKNGLIVHGSHGDKRVVFNTGVWKGQRVLTFREWTD